MTDDVPERTHPDPPVLSVLTPSFNYARYLADCLGSVESASDHVDIEHVVADGGSTDGSVDVLSTWVQHRAVANGYRMIWRSERDTGQSDALNRALARASGEWVGWLNADEYYLRDGLADVLRVVRNTSADVVVGECVWVDTEGRPLRLLGSHHPTAAILRNYGCCIASCAAFFRRSVLGTAPFDVECSRAMDWDLYLTLLDAGATFEFVPVTVAAFRIHPEQVTAAKASRVSDENQRIRASHGLPVGEAEVRARRVLGRIQRIIAKVRSGAYRREFHVKWSLRRGDNSATVR